MNYEIVDYGTGILTRQNKPEAIGAILQKNNADPAVIKSFTNDPARTNPAKATDQLEINGGSDQIIVITRDKYEAAEVSTNKDWSSCLNLGGGWEGVDKLNQRRGENAQYLVRDVSIGCIAAYLIDRNDTELDDPLARLSIKPFIKPHEHRSTQTQVALGVHDRVYVKRGKSFPPEFKTIVHQWANDINASKELDGMFILHPDAYNFDEIELDNRVQYHGKSHQDQATFRKYGTNIDNVPENLLTIGYLLLAVERNSSLYKIAFDHCTNGDEVREVAKVVASNYSGTAVLNIPEQYIYEDLIAYMELLRYTINNVHSIVDDIAQSFPELIDKLYVKDSEMFISLCKQATLYDSRSLQTLTHFSNNIELLSDLAKLPKLGPGAIDNIVATLISAQQPIDNDVFSEIISNKHTSSAAIEALVNYATKTNNKDLQDVLLNRTKTILKSLKHAIAASINTIENIPGGTDAQAVLRDMQSLVSAGISIPSSMFTPFLDYNLNARDLFLNTFNLIDDTSYKKKYIKNKDIPIKLLRELEKSIIENSTILDDSIEQEILNVISQKWIDKIPSLTLNGKWWDKDNGTTDLSFASACNDPIILIHLLEYIGEDVSQMVISEIKDKLQSPNSPYNKPGAVELATKLLPHIESYEMFTYIADIQAYFEDHSGMETFNKAAEKSVINLIKTGDMRIAQALYSINYEKDLEILKTVLSHPDLTMDDMRSVLDSYTSNFNHNEKILSLIFPVFEKMVKDSPKSNLTTHSLNSIGRIHNISPEILKIIVKFADLCKVDIPNDNDDKELSELKHKKLRKAAADSSNESTLRSWMFEGYKLPDDAVKLLLDKAIKTHDEIMLSAIYSSVSSSDILDRIDEYWDKRYIYDTLVDALNAVDENLAAKWPGNTPVAYGETIKVNTIDGDTITVSRCGNGNYALPIVEEGDSQSDKFKRLIKKGKEQGFVTYTDLDKTIPKDFEPEQVEDIIVMLNDMNIQVVSDEDIQ
jgi:hypothetical protein